MAKVLLPQTGMGGFSRTAGSGKQYRFFIQGNR
jgi:hypothetical protein